MKADKDKTDKELENDVAVINQMILENKGDKESVDILNCAKQSLFAVMAGRIVDSIETEQDDLEFLDSLCEDGLMP